MSTEPPAPDCSPTPAPRVASDLAGSRGPEPQPPEPPPPGSCCGRGCSPCIMEHYELALEAWRERHARWLQAGG